MIIFALSPSLSNSISCLEVLASTWANSSFFLFVFFFFFSLFAEPSSTTIKRVLMGENWIGILDFQMFDYASDIIELSFYSLLAYYYIWYNFIFIHGDESEVH